MTLTQKDVALVRTSLDTVTRAFAPGSTFFYDNLFRLAPDLKPLFRDDIAGQGMKFLTTLRIIVDGLGHPQELDEDLKPLAEGHSALGIGPGDFDTMREALIGTFRDVLGDRFTPDLETAWRAAFDEIAARMVALGGTG